MTIQIRDLDPSVQDRLEELAHENGTSVEEEIKLILYYATFKMQPDEGLGTAMKRLFKPVGGVELERPPSTDPKNPFEE